MPPIRLTQRRVDALRPRRKVRDIRDAELKGYGVRVMPSGAKRYFIHGQHRGKRVWKIMGDAAAITEPEARTRARSMLAALRDGREADAADPGGTLFETVAEEIFDRYGRRWKPRTLGVNRAYLRRQILPFFAGRPIGEITREDVRAWFRRQQADVIRLLLLIGCRVGEILKLQCSEVDGDHLNLADSKTGPRRVWLGQAAQAILARQPRAASAYVFPSPMHPDKPLSNASHLWHRARKEAGLDDVRLHDTRHTVASQAVARGVPLSTVARMLGHADPRMTLRYAHVGDRDLQDAAERIGKAIEAAAMEAGESPAAASS